MSDQDPPRRPPDRGPQRIGRYRIVSRLGRGAMGVVYAAHDESMDRAVALKVLMADSEGDPDVRARFFREAQVAARLGHRNVVTVFDIAEEDGRLYMVMELLRGSTLGDYLKLKSLDLEEKIDLMLQVCEGLAVASAAGVFHRDIKPGNLFVQHDGTLKILDFGIARLANSSMTASGFIFGTPDYMSPEQARGQEVDERSDIFSAGAVFYFMLSGRKPFAAPDLPAVLHKVVFEPPPPLTDQDAPEPLRRVLARTLCKDLPERLQTFRELTAELTRFKRSYEADTILLSAAAWRTSQEVERLIGEVAALATEMGAEAPADVAAYHAALSAELELPAAAGIDAWQTTSLRRRGAEALERLVSGRRAELESRLADLSRAREELEAARTALRSADLEGALDRLEALALAVPGVRDVQTLLDESRRQIADRQAAEARVRALLAQAETERAADRLAEAETLLLAAQELTPDHAEVRDRLAVVREGIAREQSDRRRRAAADLEQAEEALARESIEEAQTHVAAAMAADPEWARVAELAARVAQARIARDQADALLAASVAAIAEARQRFDEGESEAALESLNQLTAAQPTAPGVGQALEQLRAEAEARAARAQVSADAAQLAAEAESALLAGDTAAALTSAEAAIAKNGGDRLALRIEAMARGQLREAAEREARASRALDHAGRARRALDHGQLDDAARLARQAADLDPASDEACEILSDVAGRREHLAREAALEQERRGVADALTDLVNQGHTALRARDRARARAAVEQALALSPGSSEAHQLAAAFMGQEGATDTVGLVASRPGPAALETPVDPDDTVKIPAEVIESLLEPQPSEPPPDWRDSLHRTGNRLSGWVARQIGRGTSSALLLALVVLCPAGAAADGPGRPAPPSLSAGAGR